MSSVANDNGAGAGNAAGPGENADAARTLGRSLAELAQALEVFGALGVAAATEAARKLRQIDAAGLVRLPPEVVAPLLRELATWTDRLVAVVRKGV